MQREAASREHASFLPCPPLPCLSDLHGAQPSTPSLPTVLPLRGLFPLRQGSGRVSFVFGAETREEGHTCVRSAWPGPCGRWGCSPSGDLGVGEEHAPGAADVSGACSVSGGASGRLVLSAQVLARPARGEREALLLNVTLCSTLRAWLSGPRLASWPRLFPACEMGRVKAGPTLTVPCGVGRASRNRGVRGSPPHCVPAAGKSQEGVRGAGAKQGALRTQKPPRETGAGGGAESSRQHASLAPG